MDELVFSASACRRGTSSLLLRPPSIATGPTRLSRCFLFSFLFFWCLQWSAAFFLWSAEAAFVHRDPLRTLPLLSFRLFVFFLFFQGRVNNRSGKSPIVGRTSRTGGRGGARGVGPASALRKSCAAGGKPAVFIVINLFPLSFFFSLSAARLVISTDGKNPVMLFYRKREAEPLFSVALECFHIDAS